MTRRADDLAAVGLGLGYGEVRLVAARPEWRTAGDRLAAELLTTFGPAATDAAHIGSTAVTGMLAKPIVDLAVVLSPDTEPSTVVAALEADGYIYRGDAGGEGGMVFVLDVRPWVRVAHVHALPAGDPQWDRYHALVERLRADPAARAEYEHAKRALADAHPDGRADYTQGKTDVVRRLLVT